MRNRKMSDYLSLNLFFNCFVLIVSSSTPTPNVMSVESFMFWPNATIPFFINPQHFDHEQGMAIMTALSMFAFKTCLKFAPVMTKPEGDQHVMVFENPEGIRRCRIQTSGHSVYKPHSVILGYECLQSPHIDMMIMKALGFQFEHNRASRDVYIEVLVENIEPGSMELFTKDTALPMELRALPYDINSVMHFGERDYSKNGHRTIIFKDHNAVQNRKVLTPTDLRKIEMVYGTECRKRDRQEKIELCQSYPGVARRKRQVDAERKSLRVNPDITPPPALGNTTKEEGSAPQPTDDVKELGIDEEIEKIVEHAYRIASLSLKNARLAYCDGKKKVTTETEDNNKNATDLLKVIGVVSDYAKSVVNNAVSNLTILCDGPEDFVRLSRMRCDWGDNSYRCRQTYRSTKSGPVRASTQYRPSYYQSTKHVGHGKQFQYVHMRSGNDTEASIKDSSEVTEQMKDVTEKIKTVNSELKEEGTVKNLRRRREVEKDTDANLEEVNVKDQTVVSFRSKREVSDKIEKEMFKEDIIEVNGNNMDDNVDSLRRKRALVTAELNEDRVNNPAESFNTKREVDKDTVNTELNKDSIKSMGENVGHLKTVREVADKVESKPEIVILNPNGTDDLDVEKNSPKTLLAVKGDSTKVETGSLKTGSGKRQHEGQRFFQGRRYRVKNSKDKMKHDWDQSDVSLEETAGQKHARRPLPVYSSDRDVQEIKDREMENSKRKEERLEREKERSDRKKKVQHIERQDTGKSAITPKTVPLTKLNAEFYNERKWPGGIVRYVISPNPLYDLDDVRQRLAEVIDILQHRTCVRMFEVTEEDAKNYDDYLLIDTSLDYVTGRVGGKQNFGSLELFRGGQHRQHAAMMIMAMLGFYFEVARHDRDKYIRVHMRHVRPDKLHHFEKIREEATLAVPYDYRSATHPAWQFWRKIGKTGISTVATFKEQDPDSAVMKSLGQNAELLSDIDIIKINSVYGVKCFHNTRSKTKGKKREEKERVRQE